MKFHAKRKKFSKNLKAVLQTKRNTSTDIYLVIAKNIKKYRRRNKMTQKELAQISGYSYSYIRRLEGPTCIKNFSIQTIANLAKVLGIDVKALFEERDI